jgi:hypothetical protein
MRVLDHWDWQDEEVCETESFHEVVDGKLVLVQAWSLNDAMYREEYMKPLFDYLGVGIKTLPAKYRKEARNQVKETFGL